MSKIRMADPPPPAPKSLVPRWLLYLCVAAAGAAVLYLYFHPPLIF